MRNMVYIWSHKIKKEKRWSTYKTQHTRLEQKPKTKIWTVYEAQYLQVEWARYKTHDFIIQYKLQQKPKKIKRSTFKAQYIVLPISAAIIYRVDLSPQHQGAPPNPRLSQFQPAKEDSTCAKTYITCICRNHLIAGRQQLPQATPNYGLRKWGNGWLYKPNRRNPLHDMSFICCPMKEKEEEMVCI